MCLLYVTLTTMGGRIHRVTVKARLHSRFFAQCWSHFLMQFLSRAICIFKYRV